MRLRPITHILTLQATAHSPDTGRLICAGYMELGGGRRSIRVIECRGDEKAAILAVEKVLRRSHIYVSWGGTNLLVPFLTAKMLVHGIDPSPLYSARHIDLERLASEHMRLRSNSLYEICKFFRVPISPILKTSRTSQTQSGRAVLSRKEAALAVDRCRAEVAALEALTRRLIPLIMAVYRDLPSLL